tara:strand:- start:838 stop:1074 length:237 start_codon:yes stop_codon:yes gene_type:complete
MNPLKLEQESISAQVDTIMVNRFRRFKFLMSKGRVNDAIALGGEFHEWMTLDQDESEEEILYYKEDELGEQFVEKSNV